MQKPDDIPQDVWEVAKDVHEELEFANSSRAARHLIARAILAERAKWELAAQAQELDMGYEA